MVLINCSFNHGTFVDKRKIVFEINTSLGLPFLTLLKLFLFLLLTAGYFLFLIHLLDKIFLMREKNIAKQAGWNSAFLYNFLMVLQVWKNKWWLSTVKLDPIKNIHLQHSIHLLLLPSSPLADCLSSLREDRMFSKWAMLLCLQMKSLYPSTTCLKPAVLKISLLG